MKTIVLFLLAVLSSAFVVLADATKIAFERGDAVWIAHADGSEVKKIADGKDRKRLVKNARTPSASR